MKKILSTLLLFSNIGFCLSTPNSQGFDKRVVSIDYNEKDVVKIYAKNGFTTVVQLEKNERVLDMASGFADGWDLKDRGSFVFIKPIAYVSKIATNEDGESRNQSVVIEPDTKNWKTNLTIITNKRQYMFDLILSKWLAYYKVSFNYPEELIKENNKYIKKSEKEKEEKYIKKELDKTTVPRNWDYYMNINPNSESIVPDYAYDDGVFTYLGFDNTKTIPSVFLYEKVGENKESKESLVNVSMKKDGNYDVIVIHKTAKIFVLRSGEKIIGILNNSYGVNPLSKSNTTISENVQREVIENGK